MYRGGWVASGFITEQQLRNLAEPLKNQVMENIY
jgi:hypothetical protein